MTEPATVEKKDEPEMRARLSLFADKVEKLAKEMGVPDWHLVASYHVKKGGAVVTCPLAAYADTPFSKALSGALQYLIANEMVKGE